MKNEPVITAIIVCYGLSDLLYQTIDSVLMQNQSGIELLVSDDGSGRFSADIVEKYIETNKKNTLVSYRVYGYKENIGTVKNINRAIKKAKGKYIKLIGGDDIYYDSNVFQSQIAFLEEHADKMLVTGFSKQYDSQMNPIEDVRVDETNKMLEMIFSMKGEEAFAYYLHNGYSPLVTQATCFRKQFFEVYGLYDERFFLIEDAPMGARIILNEIPTGVQKEYVVKHRTDVGVSSTKEVFSVRQIRYYQDVAKYAEIYMLPNKAILGRKFAEMKYSISKFRVDYCMVKINKGSTIKKIMVIIKNIKAIIYYIIQSPQKAKGKIKLIFNRRQK